MNLHLPSDNAVIKINTVYFDNRDEAEKLQHKTNPGMIYEFQKCSVSQKSL